VIEATIIDGEGSLVARWDIVSSEVRPRIGPGSGLVVEGVPRIGATGDLLILEPAYEVVPGPDRD